MYSTPLTPQSAVAARGTKRSWHSRLRRLLLLFGGSAALLCLALVLYTVLVIAPAVEPVSQHARAQVDALLAHHHSAYQDLSRLGTWLPRATIAIEDRRFYQHGALDLRATARALLFDLRGGRPLQGGATIDVQLAERLLGTSTENLVTHALKVVVLAHALDVRYGKRGVLALYLNDIYYGSGAYGAARAAQTFFDQPPSALTVAQAAFLAGLPNAPSLYGDQPSSAATRARWALVLAALVRDHELSAVRMQHIVTGNTPLLAAATVMNG